MSSMQELSELLMKAHADAAANNDNLSSGTIKQMAIVQRPFLESMVAGLLTLGGTHAPIEQARDTVSQSPLVYAVKQRLLNSVVHATMCPPQHSGFLGVF